MSKLRSLLGALGGALSGVLRRRRVVSTTSVGLGEHRTRVICQLPVNNDAEANAVNEVITYQHTLRTQDLGIQGFMHTEVGLPINRGWWWDEEETKRWISEPVVVFTIDYKLTFSATPGSG